MVTKIFAILLCFLGRATALYCYSCEGEDENWRCNEKEPVRCQDNEVCVTVRVDGLYKRCMYTCPISRGDGDGAPCQECTEDLCNSYDFGDKGHLASQQSKTHAARAPNGSKYVLYTRLSTYWEARFKCISDGGTLATSHSETIQRFIRRNFVSNAKVASLFEMAPQKTGTNESSAINGFWIGLKRYLISPKDGEVLWIRGDNGMPVGKVDENCEHEHQAQHYQHWRTGHPLVETKNDELCAFVSRAKNGRWESLSCGRKLPAYLCHYPNDVVHNSVVYNSSIYTHVTDGRKFPHVPNHCATFGRKVPLNSNLAEKFFINSNCIEKRPEVTHKRQEAEPSAPCDEVETTLICERPLYAGCLEKNSDGKNKTSNETAIHRPEDDFYNTSMPTFSVPKRPQKTIKFCDKYVLLNESELTFPRTKVRRFGYSVEKCPNGIPKGLMFCSGKPVVEFTDLVRMECDRSLSDSLSEIFVDAKQKNITMKQATRKLHAIFLLLSNFTTNNITRIIEILSEMSENNSKIPPEVFSDIIAATAKIRRYLSRHGRNKTHKARPGFRTRLEKALEKFAQHVEMDSNNTRHKFEADGIEVEVVKLEHEDDLALEHSSNDRRSNIKVLADPPLPGKSPGYGNQKQFRAVFMSYDDDELFPTDEKVEVNSVISATVTDGTQTYSVPVEFSMQIADNKNVSSGTCLKTECRYYDHPEQLWKTDGCRVEPPVIGQRTDVVRCKCDHTTSFAVVVSEHVLPNYALDVVSTIGMIICIVCLALTIWIFLFVPELRRVRSAFTHINLCACLSIAYFIFLIGIEATRNRQVCVAVSALIHFFLLAAWGWMAVESITMYRMFVQTFDRRHAKDEGVKSAIVVYAVAAAIVLTTISFSILSQYMQWDKGAGCETDVWSTYVAESYCWLQGNSLYFGFLLIVGIFLTFNIVLSVVIIKAITWGRKSVQCSIEEKPIIHVLRAILVALLLGVAWIFAIPLVVSSNALVQEVFGWLFAITTSAQGVFVFYFFCLRRKDVRQAWTTAITQRCNFQKNKNEDVISSTIAQPFAPQSATTRFGRTLTPSTASETTRKTTVSIGSTFTSPGKNAKPNVKNSNEEIGQTNLGHSLDLVEFTGEEVFET
ncbi:adhesion G-protein coupled receptor G7-like [Styela clava]